MTGNASHEHKQWNASVVCEANNRGSTFFALWIEHVDSRYSRLYNDYTWLGALWMRYWGDLCKAALVTWNRSLACNPNILYYMIWICKPCGELRQNWQNKYSMGNTSSKGPCPISICKLNHTRFCSNCGRQCQLFSSEFLCIGRGPTYDPSMKHISSMVKLDLPGTPRNTYAWNLKKVSLSKRKIIYKVGPKISYK